MFCQLKSGKRVSGLAKAEKLKNIGDQFAKKI
jgi:hypothetical protein